MSERQYISSDSHPTIPGLIEEKEDHQILMGLHGIEISERARQEIVNVRITAKKIADCFSEEARFTSITHLESALKWAQREIEFTKSINH